MLGAFIAGVVVLLFCGVLYWRDPLLFWNDDYELSILPVFADVARSWSEGHLPLLSPYSWVCSNLAGEFQYGTFSIFVNAAVVLIWKFPLTFPQQAAALSIAHLFVLAMGGYLLGRGRNFSAPLSGMIALIAALNGWIVCWGAIDWFGALGAFAWLPWVWWAMDRALDPDRGRYRFLWPAPFAYLLITGGFPYTVIMMTLLAAWLAVKSWSETRRVRSVLPMIGGLVLGVGLSAPAWLALFDYVHGSARQAQDSSAHWQWLVPPAALPAFILPAWTVKWADFSTRLMPHTAGEMACGLVAPVALLWGLFREGWSLVRRMRWELALLLLVLIISMLPSANVFRWSFRWLPFIHLVLALCAAEALRTGRKFGAPALGLVALTAVGMWLVGAAEPFGRTLVPAMLAIAAAWMLCERLLPAGEGWRRWLPPAITFAALLATYLCIPPNCGVPRYNLDQKLTRAAPLDPQRLYLSFHPPPEKAYRTEEKPDPFGTTIRPGSTSMWGGVRLINGYSPIRPAGVAREFGVAIHGELPDWAIDYLLGWQAGPEGELARIGVDGLIVANEIEQAPQPAEEWMLDVWTDEGRVYHRVAGKIPSVRSLAWLEPELATTGAVDQGMLAHEDAERRIEFASATIEPVHEDRQSSEVDVQVPTGERPALIAFSRPFFGGYRARLDGKTVDVGSYRGLMPVVQLPAGTHGRLTLDYRPWWLVLGGITTATCAVAWLVGLAAAMRERAAAR
ncbi:MAG: hypothetical protein ABR526_01105 [Chthoniobacterales bacterium]